MSNSTFFKKKGKSKGTSEDTTFVLKDIDVAQIDKQYIELGEEFPSPFETVTKKKDTPNFSSTTSLEKLGIQSFRKEPLVTVIAKDKVKFYTYVSMIDSVMQKELPLTTKERCHGCRRQYTTMPLGIPLKFITSEYISSTGGKKRLTIKEKKKLVKDQKKASDENPGEVEELIVDNDYFETEGKVCSFNCMFFVIKEMPSEIYINSEPLIYQLYYMIFGKYPDQPINKSPSWKMRQEYEGPLTDEEFEKNLQTVKFTDTHQLSKVQKIMKPVGKVFEARDIEYESFKLS